MGWRAPPHFLSPCRNRLRQGDRRLVGRAPGLQRGHWPDPGWEGESISGMKYLPDGGSIGPGSETALVDQVAAHAEEMRAHGRRMFERWLDLVAPAEPVADLASATD